MASGKASRRKRATERAGVAADGGSPRRTRSIAFVVGGVVCALTAAVVVGVVSARSDEPSRAESTLVNAPEARALFAGVAQRGTALGRADAPVTLMEFADLQCPYCRQFAVESLPTLVERHVRSGKLRIEVRGLAFLGPDSGRGLRAVLAAGRQNRLFEVMELLYYEQGPENSGWLSQELVEAAARSIPGVDVDRLVQEMPSADVSEALEAHAADATRRSVDSTPTVFVGPTGGELKRVTLQSAADVAAVERAIAAAARA